MPVLAFLVLAVTAAPQQPAELGRIEGVATIASRYINPPARVRVYAEAGDRAARPPQPLTTAVLYLESTAALRARATAPAVRPAMRQRDERFEPHVLAVQAGTVVEFPNEDPIYHNVFSLSRARTFDLGRYPRGESKAVRFDRAGVVQVFCHIHSDMSAYIVVTDHPFFVMPDSAGRFALEGVPPGDYRLVAWHERARTVITPVTVTAGRTARVQVSIPYVDTTATR